MTGEVADIYTLNNRGQKELTEFITSRQVLDTLNLNYEKFGDVISNAVSKLFSDDAIKNKFSKFVKLFNPMSLIRIQREIKLYLDNKRDEFNKEEIKNMLFSFSVVVLFLIIRDQNEFYKNFINLLAKKVDNINRKFASFLRDSNKIYAPILSTIDEMGIELTPEIKCFYEIEERISKMS